MNLLIKICTFISAKNARINNKTKLTSTNWQIGNTKVGVVKENIYRKEEIKQIHKQQN